MSLHDDSEQEDIDSILYNQNLTLCMYAYMEQVNVF